MNHLGYARDLLDGNAYWCKQHDNQRAMNIFMRLCHEIAAQIDSPPFIRFNRALNGPWDLEVISWRLKKYHARIIDHEIDPSASEYLFALAMIHSGAPPDYIDLFEPEEA